MVHVSDNQKSIRPQRCNACSMAPSRYLERKLPYKPMPYVPDQKRVALPAQYPASFPVFWLRMLCRKGWRGFCWLDKFRPFCPQRCARYSLGWDIFISHGLPELSHAQSGQIIWKKSYWRGEEQKLHPQTTHRDRMTLIVRQLSAVKAFKNLFVDSSEILCNVDQRTS